MDERDVNRIMARSLDFGYKIPDPPQQAATSSGQRPFDGFGVWDLSPVYWEAKFARQVKSFDLSRIAPHQADALDECVKIHQAADAKVWIVYGVHVGRGDFRFWIFDWEIIKPRRDAKNNIKKKELEQLPYHSVKKQLIDIDPAKIIRNF